MANSYFGKKVEFAGYKFDSVKERDFFVTFIQDKVKHYTVHESFKLQDTFELDNGLKMRGISYAPDFCVYDDKGKLQHVYDIKASFNSTYGVDAAASIRFKWFAKQYGIPVEVVVPRTYDFRVKCMGITKKTVPIIKQDTDYNVWDALEEMVAKK